MTTQRILIITAILTLGVAGHAAAQEIVQADPGVPQERPAVEQAPTAEQIHGRFRKFQDLLATNAPDRKSGLDELLAGNDDDLAVLAARQLIADQTPGEEAAIASRISGWPERNQIILLEALRSAVGSNLDVARQVLRASIANPVEPRYSERPSAAVDLAAILVARQATTADRQLLLEALQANPNTRGLWVAAIHLSLIGAPQRQLGLATWHNEALPVVVRASAASALIGSDFAAEPFVVNAIRSAIVPQDAKNEGGVSGPLTVFHQLAMIGLIEFIPTRPANQLLTSLLGEPRGTVDPAIVAVGWLKSPASLAGKEVADDIKSYVSQFRTGLYLGF